MHIINKKLCYNYYYNYFRNKVIILILKLATYLNNSGHELTLHNTAVTVSEIMRTDQCSYIILYVRDNSRQILSLFAGASPLCVTYVKVSEVESPLSTEMSSASTPSVERMMLCTTAAATISLHISTSSLASKFFSRRNFPLSRPMHLSTQQREDECTALYFFCSAVKCPLSL